jgi:cytoskeletal protein RodZ
MRKLEKKKQNILPYVIGLLLIAGLVILVLEKTRVTDFIKDPTYKESSNGPTVEQQKQAQEEAAKQKEQYLDSVVKEQETAKPAEVPTDTDTITLTPTVAGNNVVVHNQLKGQGYSSGACHLTITNGSKTYNTDAEIIYQPEYSMCAGFTVPTSELGAGDWSVKLDVTPLNGQTLTKTANVRVS